MWFYRKNTEDDTTAIYWCNRQPYYGTEGYYGHDKENRAQWVRKETMTWRTGGRHSEHKVNTDDPVYQIMDAALKKSGGPVKFGLIIDKQNPQWYVRRVGDHLFVSDKLDLVCYMKLDRTVEPRLLRDDWFLRPQCFPEVKEKDGIVGVKIQIY